MSSSNRHGRREFLRSSTAAVLAAGAWGQRLPAMHAEDEAGVHGMLLVGEQTAFLSHLPIFGSPHDYQVILEVTFTKAGSDPLADYFADRKRSPNSKVYTMEPEAFVLPRLTAATPLRSFRGNLYRGHFERFPSTSAKNAARIAQHVDVNVTRVIHFRKFDPAAPKPTQLEYLIFGKGAEVFVCHVVTRAPDFDQVLSVKSDHPFTDDELSKGPRIVIPGKSNAIASRIRGVDPISGQIAAAAAGGASTAVQLRPVTEFYFEENELA